MSGGSARVQNKGCTPCSPRSRHRGPTSTNCHNKTFQSDQTNHGATGAGASRTRLGSSMQKSDQKTSQGRPRTTIPRIGQLAQRASKGTKGPPGASVARIAYLCGTWAHGGARRLQRCALERRYRKPRGQGPELAAEASLGRGGLGRQGRPAALRGQARAAQTRAARGSGRRWRPQRRGDRWGGSGARCLQKGDQQKLVRRPRTTIPRVGQLAQRAGTKGPPGASVARIAYLCGT